MKRVGEERQEGVRKVLSNGREEGVRRLYGGIDNSGVVGRGTREAVGRASSRATRAAST